MDESFWEQVEQSRRMTPEQRFRGTMDITDLVRKINISGIRHRHPDADDARVREILLEQYRINRKMDSIP